MITQRLRRGQRGAGRKLLHQLAEQRAQPRLVRHRGDVGGVLRVGELGEHHQERAAVATACPDLLGEGMEPGDPLRAGIGADAGRRLAQHRPVAGAAACDVRGDELVLGTEQPVQRGGRNRRGRGHGVDPGGADALPVEQVSRDPQDQLTRLRRAPSSDAAGACR
jgi:hypothetical protein